MAKDCFSCMHEENPVDSAPCNRCSDGTFSQWERKESHPVKTLLDEYAIAAMQAIIGKTPLGTCEDCEFPPEFINSPHNMTAGGAYEYAAAMMREKMRRDEMGNVKEVEN